MISKLEYSKAVEDLKKVVQMSVFFDIKAFFKTFLGKTILVELAICLIVMIRSLLTIGLSDTLILFRFLIFLLVFIDAYLYFVIKFINYFKDLSKKRPKRINKNPNKEDMINNIFNMLGFTQVTPDIKTMPDGVLSYLIKSNIPQEAELFDKIQIMDGEEKYGFFYINTPMPVSKELLIGDFSKNKKLFNLKNRDDWQIFSEYKNENTDFLTKTFMSEIEKFLMIYKGKKQKNVMNKVFLQINPDGIKGAVLDGRFNFYRYFSYISHILSRKKQFPKGDIYLHKDRLSLYECACILEKFNKYIEENKF